MSNDQDHYDDADEVYDADTAEDFSEMSVRPARRVNTTARRSLDDYFERRRLRRLLHDDILGASDPLLEADHL